MAQDGFGTIARCAVRIEQDPPILFRRKETGRDGIDANALGRPLARQELRQAQHRGLGRGIGDDAGQGHMRRNAGNVDDAPLAAPDHRRPEFLAGQQHAADHVQVEVGAPILQNDLIQTALRAQGNAGIISARGIDQNSRRADRLFDLLMCCPQRFARHRVGGKKFGLAASLSDLLHPAFAALRVASHHRDTGSRLRQSFGHGSTQRARSPNHHRNFAGQIKQIHKSGRSGLCVIAWGRRREKCSLPVVGRPWPVVVAPIRGARRFPTDP